MKMLSQEYFQVVFSAELSHQLGQGQFRKGLVRFPAERQQVGDHLDEQGGIQSLVTQLHGVYVQEGFEDFPELLNLVMLLPDVPDFRSTQERTAEIDQVIGAGGTFLEEEEDDFSKGRTVSGEAKGRNVYPPLAGVQREDLLPGGGWLLVLLDGKGIVAFASQDNLAETQLIETPSEFLGNKPRIHGQRKGGQIDAFLGKGVF